MKEVSAYAPFFHTVHYSMPHLTPEKGIDFVNLTHDSWEVTNLIHKGVSETMKVITDPAAVVTKVWAMNLQRPISD